MNRTIELDDKQRTSIAILIGGLAGFPLTEAIIYLYALTPIGDVVTGQYTMHVMAILLALLVCTLTVAIDRRL